VPAHQLLSYGEQARHLLWPGDPEALQDAHHPSRQRTGGHYLR